MMFKSLSRPFILRLLLIIGLAVFLGIAIAKTGFVWIVPAGIATILLVLEIVHYVNGINRKLTYFFDAVRNEDSTLHFSEKAGDRSIRELHTSLNRLNAVISEIKIRNERNERFYRELLHYSATGIITVDDKGYIVLINEAALDLLGLTSLANFILLKQKRNDVYNELIQLKPGHSRTLKLLKDEEIQLISVKVSSLQFGDRTYQVYSLYDIKTEMEENEVESWQKLIRVLTHEIMNSIAPITSLSNTMQRFLTSGSDFDNLSKSGSNINKTREGLQVIEETGKGLMHFIDNYRRLTKVPKPVFKEVKIEEWINHVCFLLKDRLDEENIELEQYYSSGQTGFLADKKLLTQVLINIINNAIDASLLKRSKRITLHVDDDYEGRLQISITDYGKGIAGDELDKIFIPFYTTKENGSGIGLSLSRQIMRLHKGSIAVNSQVNKKTTFTLRF
ncbi:MAG: ATP-binding protein [Bacteroidales bacterium]|jgi:signal transduction histidine kinase